MKNKTSIGGLIDWLQKHSKIGWGLIHISYFSDGEFVEGWQVNYNNELYESESLYDALLKAKNNNLIERKL